MTEKLSTLIPVTDEAIVDYGIGSEEDQRRAGERIQVRSAAAAASWRALPFWTRWRRTRAWRLVEPRHRLRHAIDALRGIDCEP